MPHTIVVLDPLTPERLARMRAFLPQGFALKAAASRDEADQLAAMRDADFAIAGDIAITGAMMREGAAHRMQAVHKWGVGVDNIACDVAAEVGLRVLRTTGSNARAVAETTLALMLALQRNVVPGNDGMRRGEWLKGTIGPRTFLLTGRTVGLIGLGYIGKNVAKMLAGFDCRVLYAKPTPLPPEEAEALNVTHVPVETLIAESDIISLHCALTDKTANLLDAAAFAAMKDDVVIVNTARGGILDESALADALRGGKVRGAALDVFEVEPTPPGHPLIGLDNVIATPHIASQAADTYGKTVGRMFENLRRVAEGEEVPALDVVV
ncbi:MAG: 2-hydroxyacid dehydrogenase [Acuticoccus sp.]